MKDYGEDGCDIQTAMLEHAKQYPDRANRPKYILWHGQRVCTTYEIAVPTEGRFRIEFVSPCRESLQGVDVKCEDGEIHLPGGERVGTLRTWHEERFEPVVEYSYNSKSGIIYVWNVYRWSWPGGQVRDERWTGNAGCVVEREEEGVWLFRCSDGPSERPDFERLVFRFRILSERSGDV